MALKDAPQCTAKAKRTGQRCERAARKGYDVCPVHGAGYGDKRPGRPIIHGRFATIQSEPIRQLMEHHQANPDPLNVFRELALVRALLDDFINRYHEWRTALLAWHESFRAIERPLAHDRMLALETVVDELEALVGPADFDDEDNDGAPVRRAIRESRKLIDDLRRPLEQGKPMQLLDLSDAVRHAETISRIVKRIEDIRAQDAISRPELLRVMTEMGRNAELRLQQLGRHLEQLVPAESASHMKDLLSQAREGLADDWLRIRVA